MKTHKVIADTLGFLSINGIQLYHGSGICSTKNMHTLREGLTDYYLGTVNLLDGDEITFAGEVIATAVEFNVKMTAKFLQDYPQPWELVT